MICEEQAVVKHIIAEIEEAVQTFDHEKCGEIMNQSHLEKQDRFLDKISENVVEAIKNKKE